MITALLDRLGRSLEVAIAALVGWSTEHVEDVHDARNRYDGREAAAPSLPRS